MRELSLNVMDIVQNSVRAGASLITVQVAESKKHDTLTITITDNGCGMDAEKLSRLRFRLIPKRARAPKSRLCFVPRMSI